MLINLIIVTFKNYLCLDITRSRNSAWIECQPSKLEVAGSNPVGSVTGFGGSNPVEIHWNFEVPKFLKKFLGLSGASNNNKFNKVNFFFKMKQEWQNGYALACRAS